MKNDRRKYRVSDRHALQHSQVMRAHFIDHQANFVGFDADFATPFEDDWKTAIDMAHSILPDETVTDQLIQFTNEVKKALATCRDKFQDSKYFIERAFPDRPAVRNQFGFESFRKLRTTQRGMIEFMKVFHLTAVEYAAELNAVGFDAAAIAEIDTLGQQLDDANTAQERMKGKRGVIAEERVLALNALWEITVRVSRAGKRIFRNDPARHNLYLLPASDEKPEELSISGHIINQANDEPMEGVSIKIESQNVEVSTDSNGNFAIADLTPGSYELAITYPDFESQIVNATVEDHDKDEPLVINILMFALE